ncbi:NAD(P)-dependent oxidoreductase [Terasakiella sp. A23]|uniref:NAD-dependent epimerase/dehydratase family protein n=1 Tax=Terasakiella sp. FCG-A23 TaxID=3080561 RepID=UPI0029542A6F|nr:NAD(P)-dependent oxidoreductase [Terasakiella sp. A23]MDV7340823.1 NAD(P)-dependent oxidoreductase [Terasakiella sp. A23]
MTDQPATINTLVTGASGFIGRAVTRQLAPGSYIALDRHNVAENGINADLSQPDLQVDLPDTIKTIYHFAGQIWGDVATELTMLDNVLAMAKACGAKKIIYASTSAVYGQEVMDRPVEETAPVAPMSPYAEGKLQCEAKLAEISKGLGMDVAVMRYFNPYGLGQFEKMAVPNMMSKARAGEKLEIFGDGEQVRDFIFIDDLAAVTLKVAETIQGFEIYNVGSGEAASINQLAQEIVAATKSTSQINHSAIPDERKNLEVHYRVANIDKISSHTGWTPQTSLKEGIRQIVAANEAE